MLAVATLLAGVVGYVDAIVFDRLADVFPANQSGNAVLLGIGIGHGVGSEAGAPRWRSWPSPSASRCDAVGATCAAPATGGGDGMRAGAARAVGRRRAGRLRPRRSRRPRDRRLLILATVCAMGMQTEVIRHVAGIAVATTYQTGALVRIAELVGGDDPDHDRSPTCAPSVSPCWSWSSSPTWEARPSGRRWGAGRERCSSPSPCSSCSWRSRRARVPSATPPADGHGRSARELQARKVRHHGRAGRSRGGGACLRHPALLRRDRRLPVGRGPWVLGRVEEARDVERARRGAGSAVAARRTAAALRCWSAPTIVNVLPEKQLPSSHARERDREIGERRSPPPRCRRPGCRGGDGDVLEQARVRRERDAHLRVVDDPVASRRSSLPADQHDAAAERDVERPPTAPRVRESCRWRSTTLPAITARPCGASSSTAEAVGHDAGAVARPAEFTR